MSVSLGPFLLRRPIGHGAMGEVWEAVHRDDDVAVAIKVLTAHHARDPVIVAGLRNEVRAVAGLDHPNIVRIFDQGVVSDAVARRQPELPAGSPWLCMEIARGGTLARMRGKIPWIEQRRLLLSLLDALGHAHARSVVHRDLKPANVLVCGEGRLLLTDFGLAASTSRPDAPAAGTPAYMAPEQVRQEWRDFGPSTDLYALGCLGWALATGHTPFRGSAIDVLASHLDRALPMFEPVFPVADGYLVWLRRLLAKSPGDRYALAADAAFDLASLPPSLPTTPRPAHRTYVPSDWRVHREPRVRITGAGLGLYGLRAIPIVDRDVERDALWEALARVEETDRAHLVVLRGPSGYGKSHLAGWVAERASELGAAFALRVVHEPSPGAEDGLAGMITRHLRASDLYGDARVARIGDVLGDASDGDVDAVSELVAPTPGRLTTGAERHATVRRYLQRVADERPVIVIVDDAQWGLDALAFCHGVLARPDGARILLVVCAQDEALAERPVARLALEELSAYDGVSVAEIGPLPQVPRRAWLREELGLAETTAVDVDIRTEGNPLFALELVGDWVSRGLLVPGAGGFVRDARAPAELPGDLRTVWRARLAPAVAGLTDAQRLGVEVAAALGRQLDLGEWEAACAEAGAEASVDVLDALYELNLAVPTEIGFALAHGMLREAILAACAEAGRLPAVHAACARALAPRGAPHRLGPHLLASGDAAAAIDALLDGAQLRTRWGDLGDALLLLDQRDAAMDGLGVSTVDVRRVDGWLQRAAILRTRGEMPEAVGLTIRAEGACRKAGWTDRLGRALIQRARGGGRLMDPLVLRQMYTEALSLATDAGDLRTVADARHGLGTTYLTERNLDEARRTWEQASRDFAAAGWAIGVAGCQLGLVELDPEHAWEHLARTEAGYRAAGYRLGVGLVHHRRGEMLAMQGRFEDALSELRASVDVLGAVGTDDAATAEVALAQALLLSGATADGLALASQVRARLHAAQPGERLSALLVELCGHAERGDWASWDRCTLDTDTRRHGMTLDGPVITRLRAAAVAGGAARVARLEVILDAARA